MELLNSIMVTGGAGFIGSNFVRFALSNSDWNIVIVDKLTYAGNLASLQDVLSDPRVKFHKTDIGDEGAISGILRRYRPSAILNFAAETHVDRSIDHPETFIQTNIVGTFHLLEAARRFYAALKNSHRDRFRFLHVSTDEVFGSLGAKGSFSELTRYDPRSPYSASKAAGDHLVKAYFETYHLPVLLTNCSNNFGPFQYPEKLVPLTILNALEGRPLPIYGDGKNVRDWLFVEDHCDGIMRVLAEGRLGENYNIGGHGERKNIEVVRRICEELDRIVPPRLNRTLRRKKIKSYAQLMTFVPDRPGHDRRYSIDSSKIKRELRWTPRFGFEDGLKNTVRWYVAHQKWCEQVQSGKYARERLGLKSTKRRLKHPKSSF